jgi:hypothetical protein
MTATCAIAVVLLLNRVLGGSREENGRPAAAGVACAGRNAGQENWAGHSFREFAMAEGGAERGRDKSVHSWLQR